MSRPERPEDDPTFAPWWQPLSRREFEKGTVAFAAVTALSGVAASGCKPKETETNLDSLQLQKEQGWDVGREDGTLVFTGRSFSDAKGGSTWINFRTSPSRLIAAYQPGPMPWRAYSVPTLMQSLSNSDLSTKIYPVFDNRMKEAYGRGEALASDLLSATDNAAQTLIIVDMPGPEAVAFGAGMADKVHLVTTFDNWPHPSGVVPSHQTLGAQLYYASTVEEKKSQVPVTAPTAILLDSSRLNAYTDADSRFDNRYPAKLPDPANLKALGVTQVLYVTPDRTVTREPDDLNDLFVAYRAAGVGVNLLPAADLQYVAEPAPTGGVNYRYYYGGSAATHFYFFSYYPFYRFHSGLMMNTRIAYRGAFRAPGFGRMAYAPAARATVFSGSRMGGASGIGRARPAGFGRTSVRVAGGRVTGVRMGRSGSFGRVGFGRSG